MFEHFGHDDDVEESVLIWEIVFIQVQNYGVDAFFFSPFASLGRYLDSVFLEFASDLFQSASIGASDVQNISSLVQLDFVEVLENFQFVNRFAVGGVRAVLFLVELFVH